ADADTGVRLVTIEAPEGHPWSAVLSLDGKKLASVFRPHGSAEKPDPVAALHLWDARTGKESRVIPGVIARHQRPAFSPDGTLVAAASQVDGHPLESEVKVWEVE